MTHTIGPWGPSQVSDLSSGAQNKGLCENISCLVQSVEWEEPLIPTTSPFPSLRWN